MKQFLLSALSLGVLCAAPALAADDLSDLETRLEGAIADLAEKAANRSATREDFQAARNLLERRYNAAINDQDAKETANIVKMAAERSLGDLEAMTRQEKATREEFQILEQEVMDSRVDRAVRELRRRALARGASRADFQNARNILLRQAEKAKNADEQRQYFGNVTTAMIDELASKADSLTAQQLDRLHDAMVDDRLDRALHQLARRANARGASRADFQRASDILERRSERAKAANDQQEIDLLRALRERLKKLEERAQAGEWPREEYAAARSSIMVRARAASSGK